MDIYRQTAIPIYCEYAEEEGTSTEKTTIASLKLYEKQQFIYLFDFGDE